MGEDAANESPSGPSDPIPQDPIGREGRSVRLREATLADAAVLDARDADPAMVGEFIDLGQPSPKPLADQLADGKRMVSLERGRLLVERIDDGAVIGDVSWHVDNVAEQRSLDKAGFTREGVIRRAQYRAGAYHDLVGYSFVRDDLERGG